MGTPDARAGDGLHTSVRTTWSVMQHVMNCSAGHSVGRWSLCVTVCARAVLSVVPDALGRRGPTRADEGVAGHGGSILAGVAPLSGRAGCYPRLPRQASPAAVAGVTRSCAGKGSAIVAVPRLPDGAVELPVRACVGA